MLTGWFRKEAGETIDVLGLSRKNSTPGSAIPETIVQSQIECVLVRKSDDTASPPVTTKTALYRCFLFGDEVPEVSQVIKRSDDERLTILTKPEIFNGVVFFDCQHTS